MVWCLQYLVAHVLMYPSCVCGWSQCVSSSDIHPIHVGSRALCRIQFLSVTHCFRGHMDVN